MTREKGVPWGIELDEGATILTNLLLEIGLGEDEHVSVGEGVGEEQS